MPKISLPVWLLNKRVIPELKKTIYSVFNIPVFSVSEIDEGKKYKIFCFVFRSIDAKYRVQFNNMVSANIYFQRMQDKWRNLNSHNETHINGSIFDFNNVVVGNKTYGELRVEAASNDNSKLIIGNYVSIGPDVRFILASEHPYKGLSTFPFKVKLGFEEREAKSKGDIVVDDDVWIGLGAIICSGVHIGQGAIIAAGAVVTKDVEPYSIVGGNPAKHIKYRFNENIRSELVKLDFSQIDEQKIVNNIDAVYEELTEGNIKNILSKIGEMK